MVVYESWTIFIGTCKSNVDKAAAVGLIIDALMLEAATATATSNITEYSLNDGQTQIRSSYRGMQAILDAIIAFERLQQMYLNRAGGRMVRLVDGSNFIGNRLLR